MSSMAASQVVYPASGSMSVPKSPPASLTTPSLLRHKQRPAKLLLEAFPPPPNHIPASSSTPRTSTPSPSSTTPQQRPLSPNPKPPRPFSLMSNPPPSLPPSAPLPPVPGPSPIIDQDTLLLLSSSSRSRRSFKLGSEESGSTSPAPSKRDSSTSNGSASKEAVTTSYAYSVSTYGANGRRESVASVRSTRSFSGSSSSLRAPTPGGGYSPSVPHSISENDETATRRPPPVIRTSPQHLSDIDDDNEGIDIDVVPPTATRSPRVPRGRTKNMEHGANDSITSIDMKELKAAMGLRDEEGGGGDSDPGAPPQPPRVIRRVSARLSSSGSASGAIPPSQEKPPAEGEDERSSSPDIKSIISATPRRRSRRPSSNYSDASSSVSHNPNRSSATTSTTARPGQRRRRSDVMPTPPPSAFRSSLGGTMRRASDGSSARSSAGYDGAEPWDEDSFVEDYGTQVVREGDDGISDDQHPEIDEVVASLNLGLGMDHDEHRFDRLGEDGGEGSDSDSSLDLHTPLPHLMLRHGLLSPNSKLLPGGGRVPSPQQPPPTPDRPGSIFSVASSMTKTGIQKDERDTPKRRHRHRDGKLLRGGIGLTTGLGWSDSEDEDAPSPLTRRISTLNLSRRTSAASIRSSSGHHAHPLSRSYSNGSTLREDNENENEFNYSALASNSSKHSKPRTSQQPLPPATPAQRKRVTSGRTSTSSTTSSLALSIPDTATSPHVPPPSSYPLSSSIRRPTSQTSASSEPSEMVRTPSSTSTLSSPLPVTPEASDEPKSPPSIKMATTTGGRQKVLPPLPDPTATLSTRRRYPSNLSLVRPDASSPTTTATSPTVPAVPAPPSNFAMPRPRAYSSAYSTLAPKTNSTSSLPSTPTATQSQPQPRTPNTPRPLHLPQAQVQSSSSGQQQGGAKLAFNRNIYDQQRKRNASTPSNPPPSSSSQQRRLFPNSSTDGTAPKPKPRTGTGMVYRTGSMRGHSDPPPSSLRARLPSMNTSAVVAKATPMPQAIAL